MAFEFTPEYRTWADMKTRCYNPKVKGYHRYGGRGIKVCDRWIDSFANFFKDMGPRPSSDHSIDRIDNDGDYEPNNCRWATEEEQRNNRSVSRYIEIAGKRLTLLEASAQLGIEYKTLWARIEKGWKIEDLFRSVGGIKYTHDGLSMGLMAWSRRTGIHPDVIRARLRSGMSFSEAITKVSHKALRVLNGEAKTLKEWAAIYGVKYATLTMRLHRGWELEEALTT